MNQEATDFWQRALQALATGKHIASSDPDAAASRAYYSAFYAVSALFSVEGKTFIRHSGIETAVHRELVKTNRWPRELGEDYAFLLRLRSTGDYGGQMHVTREEALDAIHATERILSAVHQESPKQFPRPAL
ncbi:MAG: HEPN domain-containing protein [Nitrospirales bacterium]|nr:HEPN domain-containing protein [Nitrospira sp.]MDR4500630.1 HEPN domain-containing protein [Nitrospirales bacterium]